MAFNPKAKNIKQPGIPAALTTKATAINAVIDWKQLELVDGYGHSEGGTLLVLAATDNPHRFRNFVFAAPAGINGKESYLVIVRKEIANLLLFLREKKKTTETERQSIRQKNPTF